MDRSLLIGFKQEIIVFSSANDRPIASADCLLVTFDRLLKEGDRFWYAIDWFLTGADRLISTVDQSLKDDHRFLFAFLKIFFSANDQFLTF